MLVVFPAEYRITREWFLSINKNRREWCMDKHKASYTLLMKIPSRSDQCLQKRKSVRCVVLNVLYYDCVCLMS